MIKVAFGMCANTYINEFLREFERRVFEAEIFGRRRQDETEIDVNDVSL